MSNMAYNNNNKNGRTDKMTVPDVMNGKIFDWIDSTIGEKYTKRQTPVKGFFGEATKVENGKDIKPEGWLTSWQKGRGRVNTSPVSFHADELLPMVKGLVSSADNLAAPFRDDKGQLFGGKGLNRRGPQFGLTLETRVSSLLQNVKRGDDIVDCYIRGLETPNRRKTYAPQQPPQRSYGVSGKTRDDTDPRNTFDRKLANMEKQADKKDTHMFNLFTAQQKEMKNKDEFITNLKDRVSRMEANERARQKHRGE